MIGAMIWMKLGEWGLSVTLPSFCSRKERQGMYLQKKPFPLLRASGKSNYTMLMKLWVWQSSTFSPLQCGPHPYKKSAQCAQTGARMVADIQLGSSLVIVKSAKSDNKRKVRGKLHCVTDRMELKCNSIKCAALYDRQYCIVLQCTEILQFVKMHWNVTFR